jgi:YVTN family beta-propeller protein
MGKVGFVCIDGCDFDYHAGGTAGHPYKQVRTTCFSQSMEAEEGVAPMRGMVSSLLAVLDLAIVAVAAGRLRIGRRVSGLLAIAAFVAVCLLTSARALAQNAYITNSGDNTVSVIDTTSNTVTATIGVGINPFGVAVTRDGRKVYVTNGSDNTVSVLSTATNTVTATIGAGLTPQGVAVTRDGSTVYVTNQGSGTVSVIDTASNTVTATIGVGRTPQGVAVTPDGSKVYVANFPSSLGSGTISVIDTASNTVTATIRSGNFIAPFGVVVTPDGSTVYVTEQAPGSVLVINTARNLVTATIGVGTTPQGVAVTPDGSTVYGAIPNAPKTPSRVFVIDTATNTVTAQITVGSMFGGNPIGVAITPDGSKVYVAGSPVNTVSVIDTATNTVVGSPIPVGTRPAAFGLFIQPVIILPPSEVATTASGLAYSRVSQTFNGTVTITNISSNPISGPFSILFASLTAGVTLVNAQGTSSGSPFLIVPGTAKLAAGQSASVSVEFQNPSFGMINFMPVVYSGSL